MKNFELIIALANTLSTRPLYISFWDKDVDCIPIRSVVSTKEKTILIGGDEMAEDKDIMTVSGLRIALATADNVSPVVLRRSAESEKELTLDFVSVRLSESGVYFRAKHEED